MVAGRYLAAYQKVRPFDLHAVEYYEAQRYISILAGGGGTRPGKRRRDSRMGQPSAYSDPGVQAGIITRVREITGVTVALPPDTGR